MPGIDRKKISYTVWLLLGLALFGQGLITGGGLYGALVTWQIQRSGVMLDPLLGVVLFGLLLIVPPSILLLMNLQTMGSSERARRAWVRRGLVSGTSGFVFLIVIVFLIHQSPDGLAVPFKIDLDKFSPAPVSDHTADLAGTLQTGYAVSYEELHRNAHRRRTYAPLTPAGWSPSQPVHFLVEPEGNPTGGPRPYTTGLGMLLNHGVPVYVRTLLERRGVVLAQDVMLHVDLGTENDTLYVLAFVAFLGGLLGFFLAFVSAFLQPLRVEPSWMGQSPPSPEPVIRRLPRIDPQERLYLLWLAAGLAIALHDFTTGGGCYGALVTWSIRRWGSMSSGVFGVPLALALIFPPAGLLFAKSIAARTEADRSRALVKGGLIAAGCLFSVAAAAFLRSYAAPDPSASPIRVVLDEAGPEPTDHTAILVGALRTKYAIAYTVYTKLAHYRRVFVPLTPSTWKPGEPVRYLAEPAEIEIGADRPYTTGRGMLLHHRVPGYVRTLFKTKGIALADDVMLHTWRLGEATADADVVALASAFGGFLSLALALGGWSRRGGRYATE